MKINVETIVISHLFLTILLIPVSSLNYLQTGSRLDVEKQSDVLISQNKVFTCGFHEVGTNAFSFSIWYTISPNTITWTANHNRPVNGHRSRAVLKKDGTMVVTDPVYGIVWSTNTTMLVVDRAELTNSGDLVLKDTSGKILWRSFDYPTDTLLPGQPITKDVKLTTSNGDYELYYDNDNVLRMIYIGPDISSIYWPDPDKNAFQNGRTTYNNTRIGVFDDMGRFISSDQLHFSASDMGQSVRRRLTLDVDGNLRLYSLNETTATWKVTWKAVQRPCNVHGTCGRNGICTNTPLAKCSCPTGYDVVDHGDWSKGCKPLFKEMECGSRYNPHQWNFIELPYVDFYGYDGNYTNDGVSFETCRNKCQVDCTCKAFVYRANGDGHCFPKVELFNGRGSVRFVGNLFLKLQLSMSQKSVGDLKVSDLDCSADSVLRASAFVRESSYHIRQRRTSGKSFWFFGFIFVSALGGVELLFIGLGWWFLSGRHSRTRTERGYKLVTNEFKKFSYRELREATGGFRDELGKGGSGEVYKGVLNDKRVIAVKRLVGMEQGAEEFRSELSVIGRIYHMNLVRMWGFCLEQSRRLLVYEFVENGSLDKVLFNAWRPLTWARRFRIALGTAKGLAYLHHECLDWIIHCDIKPENILLDSNYEPKIADFGLVKLSQRGGHGSNMSRIRGTKGYMAPEWTSNVPITSKVDVYSFGVILLELVMGRRISSLGSKDGELVEIRKLVRNIKKMIVSNEDDDSWVEVFADPMLNGDFDRNQVDAMLGLAVSCLEEERNKRPEMGYVVQILLSL